MSLCKADIESDDEDHKVLENIKIENLRILKTIGTGTYIFFFEDLSLFRNNKSNKLGLRCAKLNTA